MKIDFETMKKSTLNRLTVINSTLNLAKKGHSDIKLGLFANLKTNIDQYIWKDLNYTSKNMSALFS